MGYRSDVECLIYGNPTIMTGAIMRHNHTASHRIFHTGEGGFGSSISQWEDDGVAYLHLQCSDWKWYDTYTAVHSWQQFMEVARDAGLAVEFARIGEEDTDTEIIRWPGAGEDGTYVEYLLGVSRVIYCDAPRSEEAGP